MGRGRGVRTHKWGSWFSPLPCGPCRSNSGHQGTCCFRRAYRFCYQQPHVSSQLSLAPSPRDPDTLFWLCGHHTHIQCIYNTCKQNMHTHTIKINKSLKKIQVIKHLYPLNHLASPVCGEPRKPELSEYVNSGWSPERVYIVDMSMPMSRINASDPLEFSKVFPLWWGLELQSLHLVHRQCLQMIDQHVQA